MQTPTPYEQREHQLCFFFIQLNRQVSSVRKKSQCAFYVVICLPAPRANETKVVLFLKKTKSALPFCLSLSTKPHDSPIKYSYWYTSLLILLSPPVLPVAFCAATLSSFRATTRNPEIPGHGITQDARTVRHYSTNCHLQKLDPASSAGDTVMFILLCSEKNEPRSAAAVIGLSRSEAGTALGGCGTRCTQTVLALIPQPAGLLPAR